MSVLAFPLSRRRIVITEHVLSYLFPFFSFPGDILGHGADDHPVLPFQGIRAGIVISRIGIAVMAAKAVVSEIIPVIAAVKITIITIIKIAVKAIIKIINLFFILLVFI